MSAVKYPDITVRLAGEDGNAFSILGIVRKEMRIHKVPVEDINKYINEAMSGDYNHLLATTMKWVNVI